MIKLYSIQNILDISSQNLQMFQVDCIFRLFKECTSTQGGFSCHELYSKAITVLLTAFSTISLGQVLIYLHNLYLGLFSGSWYYSYFDSFIDCISEFFKYFLASISFLTIPMLTFPLL